MFSIKTTSHEFRLNVIREYKERTATGARVE